jgi:enoyl-CoA hydratase/carnithine racemase
VRTLLDLPVPVVAAAAGHAIGGGLLVALWCDAIVLGEESLYGANFMALGFTPGMGATHAVPEAFGAPLGRELLWTGRLLTGREIRAASCPLSHAVRPRAQVMEQALMQAREIADAPRGTIVLLKRMLAASRREALERALRAEASAHATLHADPATAAEIGRRYPTAPTGRNR